MVAEQSTKPVIGTVIDTDYLNDLHFLQILAVPSLTQSSRYMIMLEEVRKQCPLPGLNTSIHCASQMPKTLTENVIAVLKVLLIHTKFNSHQP